MKIIILEHEPFTKRKLGHYYIENFREDNFQVEYWDLRNVLQYSKEVKYLNEESNNIVVKFNTKEELISKISEQRIEDTFFFVEIWYIRDSFFIFELLKRQGLKWGKLDYYLNPTSCFNVAPSFTDKVRNLSFSQIPSKVENFIFQLVTKNSQSREADLYFITGSNVSNATNFKKVISLDYFDVIEFEKEKILEPIVQEDYIVFLDIMILDHPDFQRLGFSKTCIEKEYYYRKLNQVFDLIEEKYQMPVIIASHPKAQYSKEFNSRKCFYNVTSNLVINSCKVLTHGSLSISYALLAKKELLYLDFKHKFKGNSLLKNTQDRIYRASKLLGCKVIDVENFDLNNRDLLLNEDWKLDESIYSNFLKKHYLSESKEDNYTIIKINIKAL